MAGQKDEKRRRYCKVIAGMLFVLFGPALSLAQSPPRELPKLSFSDAPIANNTSSLTLPPDSEPMFVPVVPPSGSSEPIFDPNLQQASCTACDSHHMIRTPQLKPDTCGCAQGPCYPGRPTCHCNISGHSFAHRFLGGIYQCICCPDPCYEGKWTPIADSAFFTQAVRPVAQTKITWDAGTNFIYPDRAEYFWARADGQGQGPQPDSGFQAITSLRYHELRLYTEAGSGRLTAIVDVPYRNVDPDGAPHAAGFGDIVVGTKALLFDCELIQVSFQFLTHTPSGRARLGLGVGHVSLEPTLLFGIRIGPDTYMQNQLSEWIPLGGDTSYEGSILHYHGSLNHVLWRILPDVPLIGTLEFVSYSFQTGQFTSPVLGSFQKASGDTYAYLGASWRIFVCNRIDFGFGARFALTNEHFENQLYRTEFRYRY